MVSMAIGSDNINSSVDKENLQKFIDIVTQAGHQVTSAGVGSNAVQKFCKDSSTNYDVMVQIAGGVCPGTLADFIKGCGSYYSASKASIPYFMKYNPRGTNPDTFTISGPAWDDDFSNDSLLQPYKGKTIPQVYEESEKLCGYSNTTESIEILAQQFLQNLDGGTGGGTGVNVVEGHVYSHEGKTPQFWNTQTYTPYKQIDFTNFTMQDEYPRIRTATFETPTEIDLTEGRVAVLITGDCNDFGGIIIKKEFDSKTRLFKYQCQGFMERIMASPVYVVANGGHTAHHLISEYLSEIGLPSVNLKEEDDYDVFVDEATQELLKANKDEYDSVEMFDARNDLKINKDSVTGVYGKTSEEDIDSESADSTTEETDSNVQEQKTAGLIITQEESHDDEYEVINTFKAKPAGIYDKLTGGDFIRTLIFDYGINVDFYGDVNGIPHFDIMDMEKWKNTGWIISPEMGFGSDYDTTFDITDVVTQVGVKNIQAINGNGELYTSTELLGVNLEKYIGRMGTIVDNPNEKQAGSANQTDQIQGVYVDDEGNEYAADQVINTNGEPACSSCASENGGSKPEMKQYSRSWVNKCPSCEKEGTLKDTNGKTVCSECKEEYCQFCGHGINKSSVKLTKVTQKTAVSGNTSTSDSTSSSSGSSKNNSKKLKKLTNAAGH